MKNFKNYIEEEKFQLVDMDPDTARVAVQLAKKAGLQPKSYKSRNGGLDISVEGPKKKVAKFIMSLPESKTFFEGTGKNKGESWEDGFKRRVVKTTKPEHKEKGYEWRIKGKERDEISIKLYKSKPDYKEYVKQMKRVAGHEFGG